MGDVPKHIARVMQTATDPTAAVRSSIAASWRRSLTHHGLDPGQREGVRRIEESALRERRERNAAMVLLAMPKLDSLYHLVGSSGCGVLLTDPDGVVLDLRVAAGDVAAFERWGLSPGADWSEASEGTNGIGTCISETRRVIIHRDDHFHARNMAMSCMDAPIFGAEGELIGALDVSSARADQTASFNRLIAAMVAQTARLIEAETFRAAFPMARIVVADAEDRETATLLAVDSDDLVIGATRAARKAFGLTGSGPVRAMPASDILGRGEGPVGFDRAERATIVRALARADGNVSEAARGLGIGRATLYRRMKRLGIGEFPA